MVSKAKKTTMAGGWFLLTALMLLQSFSGAVSPASEMVNANVAGEQPVDTLALPTDIPAMDYGYSADMEMVGLRDATKKVFVTDEGRSTVVSPVPIHYKAGDTWEEIDLNLAPSEQGWEVTENNFVTEFPFSPENGVSINMGSDYPIVAGIQPGIVTIDSSGMNPMMYEAAPPSEGASTGGNVIRYPLAEGFSLDYMVTPEQVKQNLVVMERPYLNEEADGWFGLIETVMLPPGFALYAGENMIVEGTIQTQGALQIRHIETGELLAELSAPVATEANEEGEDYPATYFVMVHGEALQIITAVEQSWLMDEDRQYPVLIDPTVTKVAANAGYAYTYSNTGGYTYYYAYSTAYTIAICQGVGGSWGTTCTTSTYYTSYKRFGWFKFDLYQAILPGATVSGVDFKDRVRTSYSGSRNYEVTVIKDCTTSGCTSTTFKDPTTLLSGTSNRQALINHLTYSPTSGSATLTQPSSSGTVKTISLNSGGVSDVTTAAGGTSSSNSWLGLGLRIASSSTAPFWYWCSNGYYSYYGCTSNANYPHLDITYTGGIDQSPPTATFTEYGGGSYVTASRTMYIDLTDTSGINTTAAGKPHLWYKVGSGSWASSGATLVSGSSYKATIPAVSTGDNVDYFWAFADAPSGQAPNTATLPVGGTGMPNAANAPSNPYSFNILDVNNANDNKLQLLLEGANAYGYSATYQGSLDVQWTYWEDTDEYIMEYDTSSCGSTTTYACFRSGSTLIDLRNYPTLDDWGYASSYTGVRLDYPGTITNQDGPGEDLLYYYDSTAGEWGQLGVDSSTGIEQKMGVADNSYTSIQYGSNDDGSILATIPGDITGNYGSRTWNTTYSSTGWNKICLSTNGFMFFARTTSSSASYSNCYSWRYATSYAWNGMNYGGRDGKWQSGFEVGVKVSSIKPQPDLSAPDVEHLPLMDTYVADSRTAKFTIADAGEPAVGLNINSTIGEGPTLYYDVNASGTWTSRLLSTGVGATGCDMGSCDWSTTIPGQERGATVDYYVTARDINGNVYTSANYSYTIGEPDKIFIIEWHDIAAGFSNSYTITYQAWLYDVTNEIEFKYSTSSYGYYDFATTGYQNQARNDGATIRNPGSGYIYGANPFTSNYRIATDGSDHGYEEFSVGMTDLTNYNEILTGSSNGYPYNYQCSRSFYWNTYGDQCGENIQVPSGFEFEYFGTTYDDTDRMQISRFGAFMFTSSSSETQMISNYYTSMPTLPSTDTYARAGMIAPYWSYYGAYYCYNTGNSECSIRTKLIPFGGKGMDVTDPITTDTVWDQEMSPIRVNPSGDYLEVSADLTIEAGVEVQVADGKGIVFTGTDNQLTVSGNSTHGVKFTKLGFWGWKGLAFENGGGSIIDDRHTFDYATFEYADVPIYVGNRHGTGSAYSGNVGNFTLNNVDFKDVGNAINFNSASNTNFLLTNVDVENAYDTCLNFPNGADIVYSGGDLRGCNMNNYGYQGAIRATGGGDFKAENVDIWNSGDGAITIEKDATELWNITADNNFSSTPAGYVVYSYGTDSFFGYNIEGANYANGVATFAENELTLEDITLTDLGSGMGVYVGTTGGSSAFGPSAKIANITVSDQGGYGMLLTSTAPEEFYNIDLGDSGRGLKLTGTSPSAASVSLDGLTASEFVVDGCGWNVRVDDAILAKNGGQAIAKATCASPSSSNLVTMVEGTFAAGTNAPDDLFLARRSTFTVVDFAITGSLDSGTYVGKASTDGDLRLIGIDFAGSDLTGSDVTQSSSTGAVYLGGLATVETWRNMSEFGGSAHQAMPDEVVTTFLLDGSSTELFAIGSTVTDANGESYAWLISDKYTQSGNTAYTNYTIRVTGGGGQGLLEDTEISDGDYISIELFAPPVEWDVAKTCADLTSEGNLTLVGVQLTLSADLVVDGCAMNFLASNVKVNTTAVNAPAIIIRNGGSITFKNNSNLEAVSSAYPMDIDLESGGILTFNGSTVRNIAQEAGTDGRLVVESGATLSLIGATVHGASELGNVANIYVDGGTLLTTGNTLIKNVGQTGIGIALVETSTSSLQQFEVQGAGIGVFIEDSAPAIDDFEITNSEYGIVVDGSMSLPTIYRSPLLSGASGWVTYEIDLSGFSDAGDYLQVGFDSIYAGGTAHPYYSSYAKNYMIWDRMRMSSSTDGGTSWNNITDNTVEGFHNEAPVYDCNYYGYHRNPNGINQGYYYYFVNYGGYTMNSTYYDYPSDFGFRMTSNDYTGNHYYYPYNYWAYYWPAVYQPTTYPASPDASGGMWGYYGVCSSYAYSLYNTPPDGYRIEYPIVDTSSNPGLKVHIDVFHNRADYYQDRIEWVVRTGSSVSDLRSNEFGRDFGRASISNGVINGADYGVVSDGNFATANFDGITVNNPTAAGLSIEGSTQFAMEGLSVVGGAYGVLTNQQSSGSVDLTNASISGQSMDAVYVARDFDFDLTGTISAATNGLTLGSGTSELWSFGDITFEDNTVGVNAEGSGGVEFRDVTMTNNQDDVSISGSSDILFLDGIIDTSKVDVTGSGILSRARSLQINLTADASPVADAEVFMMDGNYKLVSEGTTDASGEITDMYFVTKTVDDVGVTNINLSGYQATTVATIAYDPANSIGDFRYAMESLTLADAPDQYADVALTDHIDSRVCYRYSSTSYVYQASCPTLLSTSGVRTLYSDGVSANPLVEYGYFGAMQGDHSNEAIMIDAPYFYLQANDDLSWNNSQVFVTGAYTFSGAGRWYATGMGDAHLWADTTNIISVGTYQGDMIGYQIGYYYYNDINPHIVDSNLIGVASIQLGNYFYGDADTFDVQDSVLQHFRVPDHSTTSYYEDMCVVLAGVNDAIVSGNTFYDCGVDIFMRREGYASGTQSTWGTDDAVISDNEFINTVNLGVWFYLDSYADDIDVTDNVWSGSTKPYYGIYTQDDDTYWLDVDGNTFSNAEQAVYFRGVSGANVTENIIYGDSDASHMGIYYLDGYGTVADNEIHNAYGGIGISGIEFGETLTISGNLLDQSDRDVPAGTGIWAEDCGLSTLILGDNDIEVSTNALVTDGCDVTDTGSSYSAGGSGVGGRIWNVDIYATYFTPSNLTINTGDTIRWREQQYHSNPSNYQHRVVNNGTPAGLLFDSGDMNLGSSFTHTFTSAGSYPYHDYNHPEIYGIINVVSGGSSNLQTLGWDVQGGSEVIAMDGVTISGFTTAYEQNGGTLQMVGGTYISGEDNAIKTTYTDIIVQQGLSETYYVDIDSSGFDPSSLNINKGDTVVWENFDTTDHSVVSDTGVFDSGTLSPPPTPQSCTGINVYMYDTWGDGNYGLGGGIYSSTGTLVASTPGSNWGSSTTFGPFSILEGEGYYFYYASDSWPSETTYEIKYSDGTLISSGGVPGPSAPFSISCSSASGPTSWSYTFNEAGTFDYSDSFSASTGTVTVSASGSGMGATLTTGVNGTGLYASGLLTDVRAEYLETTGSAVGLLMDGVSSFNFNFGASDATTTLQTTNGASGYIQNMTWGDTTTQIDAGAYSIVTSVSNTLDPTALVVDPNAIIHEGNLLDLEVTYMGGAASNVGLLIQSTDLEATEYVSPSWRGSISVASSGDQGDLSDWFGQPLLPSDDVKPGYISGDSSDGVLATLDGTNLYLAVTGHDLSSAGDLMIYLDTRAGGTDQGLTWYNTHTLPFQADYALWAEDGSSEFSWGLKQRSMLGTWTDASCTGLGAHIGWTDNTNTEIQVPLSCIGEPSKSIRMLAIVQDETTSDIVSVHPDQPYNNSNSYQIFGRSVGVKLRGDDLGDGLLESYLLIYRSFIGSTTPTPERDYDVTAKVGENWGTYNTLDMSENRDISIDILRARPIIEGLEDQVVLEDTGTTSISLTNLASDLQDAATSLTWTGKDDANPINSLETLLDWEIVGQTLYVTTKQDQFGHYKLWLTVTDSHGLNRTQSIFWNITNVNDAPVIWNSERVDGMPIFADDGFDNLNIVDENFGSQSKFLGSASNVTGSFILDMGNEQPQTFTWDASVTDCDAFSVEVHNNILTITESIVNEYGGTCAIELTLTDGGAENAWATPVSVDFTVNPVNDDPVVDPFDASHYVEVANGSTEFDWYWEIMEDDTNTDNLTFNLSRMKSDSDHFNNELTWEVAPTGQCTAANYFDLTVSDDELVFDLVPDATTDAPASEIDYLYDSGVHQMQPLNSVYCMVRVYLNDTALPPDHIDYSNTTYTQGSTSFVLNVRIRNQPEPTPDYRFDLTDGFDFHHVQAILTGTRVPVTINVEHQGDLPPYKYDHDIVVRFYTDDGQTAHSTVILDPPAYGEDVDVDGFVVINSGTTEVNAMIDVLTVDPRDGNYTDLYPSALQDKNWANNNMTTTMTGDELPTVVGLKVAGAVPSFAPSLFAVTIVGAFIGLLIIGSRREEDEEDLEDDDEAVSPVIATILLVAITVVLAGVIYVWAGQLAQTNAKSIPRVVFTSEANTASSDPHLWYWKITIQSASNELATQAVEVTVEWLDYNSTMHFYKTTLSEREGVYGFTPSNAPDSFVTFFDNVECTGGNCVASFGSADYIGVKMYNPDLGLDVKSADIQISYNSGGSVILKTYTAKADPPIIR